MKPRALSLGDSEDIFGIVAAPNVAEEMVQSWSVVSEKSQRY
jgi:hypothetical protein